MLGDEVLQVIVTGGSGFIGSHLCRFLLERNHEVACLDNFYSSSRDSIRKLLSFGKFRILEQDVCQPIEVNGEEVYNLACPASPNWYSLDRVRTLRTNVFGTANVLEMARRVGAKVLQASTSEIYGDPTTHPQSEQYCGNVNPIGDRACYSEGKRCAEALTMEYHRQYGISVKIGRIFNTYGPGMRVDDGRVIPNFIVQALQNKELTIYGDGRQTRSFCYIDDLIWGLKSLMDTETTVTGPVNLGNPEEVTVYELARAIIELIGSSSPIVTRELPEDDPQRRCPDTSRAEELIAWSPTVSLKVGLLKTIASFDQVLLQGKVAQVSEQ